MVARHMEYVSGFGECIEIDGPNPDLIHIGNGEYGGTKVKVYIDNQGEQYAYFTNEAIPGWFDLD